MQNRGPLNKVRMDGLAFVEGVFRLCMHACVYMCTYESVCVCVHECGFVCMGEEYCEMKAQGDSLKERQQVVLGALLLWVKEAFGVNKSIRVGSVGVTENYPYTLTDTKKKVKDALLANQKKKKLQKDINSMQPLQFIIISVHHITTGTGYQIRGGRNTNRELHLRATPDPVNNPTCQCKNTHTCTHIQLKPVSHCPQPSYCSRQSVTSSDSTGHTQMKVTNSLAVARV